MILAQILRRRGISAIAKEAGAFSVTKLFGLDFKDGNEICVCYVQTATPAQQQYALRRLHRTAPASHIMLVMLGEYNEAEEGEAWQLPRYAESIRGSLDKIAERISAVATLSSARSDTPLKLVN
jgi:hypothetical protein